MNTSLQHVLAAVIPPLLILLWLNRRGRPWSMVALSVALGVGCAEVAGYCEDLLTRNTWHISNFGMLFTFTMVVAGMVEELCKYAAFRIGPGRTRWFCEEYDGVLFVAAVSLGFAGWENIGYVSHTGLDTAMVRAYTAIPMHAACGMIMGSYLGRARVRELHGWSPAGLGARGVAIAIFIHGLYDMLAFTPSPVAEKLLYVVDLGAVIWAVRLAVAARRRSPSYGGIAPLMPDASTPTAQRNMQLPVRDERVSAVLGLVPGLGQAYNGEYRKGATFALIFVLNLALYAAIHLFVTNPTKALAYLMQYGVQPALSNRELVWLLANGQTMLDIMLAVSGAWIVFSGLDAWLTARRAARLEGLDVSYLVHVVLIAMLVLGPLMLGGGGGSSDSPKDGKQDSSYQVTWVDDPATINGWNPDSQGRGDGKGDQKKEGRTDQGDEGNASETRDGADHPSDSQPTDKGDIGVPSTSSEQRQRKRGPRDTASERVDHGDPNKSAPGVTKSYNDYLTARLHQRVHAKYFDHVPTSVWTVVHYKIAGDGTLLELSVVETNGTQRDAQWAVESVASLVPLAPLPEKVSAIDVTELFWQNSDCPVPSGSLAEELSMLPDGRRIRIEH